MTSLVHLLAPSSPRRQNLSIERTAAVILTKFEQMWNQFIDAKGSFEPFLDSYLMRWMHRYVPPSLSELSLSKLKRKFVFLLNSDQLVTLTTVTPPVPVRIIGITLDYGLLRTVPERFGYSSSFDPYWGRRGEEEEYVDLQPDGNSFDLMKGMIKTKY